METIKIKTVLELVAAEICRTNKYDKYTNTETAIPSLNEQTLLVHELLPQAMFDGRTLSFGYYRYESDEIPFFNYLILAYDLIFMDTSDGGARFVDRKCRILGFSSFEELDNFIQNNDGVYGSRIYVRHKDYYQQVQYRLAFQRPGEEKMYTDWYGFYAPDAAFNDTYSRNPDYKYFFEIVGLCEMHCNDETWCFITTSLDELALFMLGREETFYDEWLCKLRDVVDYRITENGDIYYEGKNYTYLTGMDNHGVRSYIYDTDGNPYCPRLHAFCSEDRTCCSKRFMQMPYN